MKICIPLAVLIILAGCGKHESPVHPAPEPPIYALLAVSGISTTSSQVYSIRYDANHIAAFVSSTDSVFLSYDAAGRLISKTTFTNNISFPTKRQDFTYDSAGNLINEKTYSGPGGSYGLIENHNYQYSAGKISDLISTDNTGAQVYKINYTWFEGNIKLMSNYDNLNNLVCVDTLSYDLSHENNIARDFPLFRLQTPYFLSSSFDELLSKNPLIKITHSCSAVTDVFSYSYNIAGNITTIDNGPVYEGYRFTYY